MHNSLRLLTSSRHPTYTRALASLGHRLDVAAVDPALQHEPWRAARTLPEAASVVPAHAARQRLARGDYDAVICHGLDDLAALGQTRTPAVTVFHTTRVLDRLCGLTPTAVLDRLGDALDRAILVFDASDVRESWGLDGDVIASPVDEVMREHTGDLDAAVRIDDLEFERACLAGEAPLDQMLLGLPCAVLGHDDDRADAFARHRLFVTAPRAPLDCGTPRAMLEAMAAGVPVVTMAHPATPLVHGVTGLIAEDAADLRGHVLDLLGDPDRALAIGDAGRLYVRGHHGSERFGRAWRRVLAHVHDASRSPLRTAS